METLKQLIRAVIVEGAMEQEVTQVSRKIVDQLKLRLSKNAGFVRSFKFKVPLPDSIEAKHVEVTVKRGSAELDPIVSGSFTGDPDDLGSNTVKVTIEVPKTWSDFTAALGQLSAVIPELKDILRHEFEHTAQPAEDYIGAYDLDDLEQLIKYFLDPAEVSATVAGMYKNAKTRRVDLRDVFNDRQREILSMARSAGANGAEAQEIAQAVLDRWVAYAAQRFPSARL